MTEKKKLPKDMTLAEWLEWAQSCKRAKPVRGGAMCFVEETYGYCSYHGCPERTGRV